MMSFKEYITGTISRIKIAFITAKTLSVLFSFLIGGVISDLFHDSTPYLGSMLAAISSLVVLPEEDFDKTLKVGWRRVLGSFIGAVMGVIYLLLVDFSFFGMVIAIFILSIICMALSVLDNGKIASVVLIRLLVRSSTFAL